mmetsp:Transcript_2808/g.5192  ORF Transcript_2808/g.5192 Transcript_2808/m.5192 type:complete len:82 (-) Transcript_2808:2032-2277(-)
MSPPASQVSLQSGTNGNAVIPQEVRVTVLEVTPVLVLAREGAILNGAQNPPREVDQAAGDRRVEINGRPYPEQIAATQVSA